MQNNPKRSTPLLEHFGSAEIREWLSGRCFVKQHSATRNLQVLARINRLKNIFENESSSHSDVDRYVTIRRLPDSLLNRSWQPESPSGGLVQHTGLLPREDASSGRDVLPVLFQAGNIGHTFFRTVVFNLG
jgi:hypothetical protein